MARNEHRAVAHGPQALGDAGDQRVVVALRKIGAANGPGKQHIAHKGALDLRRIKNHMTGRMSRAVTYLQRAAANGDCVTVKQPAGGSEGICMGKAESHALLGQAINPELVRRMRADDGELETLRQFCCAARMVNVGMGLPDLRQGQPQTPDFCEQQIEIATGVDDGGLQGFVAPDNGAVLLKIGDRDCDVAQHDYDDFGL